MLVLFVDALHNSCDSKDHCQEETKLIDEMNKLKSFVSSVEPYGCNHEEFPGVKVSFQGPFLL